MARKRHIKVCTAPICISEKTDGWQKKRIWYPGEKICDKHPYTKVQKFQKTLNKLLKQKKLKYPNRYFTYRSLDKREKVNELTRGSSPV